MSAAGSGRLSRWLVSGVDPVSHEVSRSIVPRVVIRGLEEGWLALRFGLVEAVIGPEVDQFFFGKFMWRHVAAKGLTCGQGPGVD